MTCEYVVERASAGLPNGATHSDLFTVSGGRVILTRLLGKTTSSITAAGSFEIQVDTGAVPASVASSFSLNGSPADYLITAQGGTSLASGALDLVLQDGDVVRISSTDTASGSAAWTLVYQPLDPGASVSAA